MHIAHLHFASEYKIKVQIYKDIYPLGLFKGIDCLATLSPCTKIFPIHTMKKAKPVY